MQVALITGGSSGIGRATAVELARRGLGVILTYSTHELEAKETVQQIEGDGGSAVAIGLDVGDLASHTTFVDRVHEELASKWGASRLHCLVNNAGIGAQAMFTDVTEEQFDRFHNVLFRGPYFLTQRLLPLLEDGGAIVNTGSNSALDTGVSVGYSSYASQKGAMHVITRHWAKELAERGIRVNAVAPGSTRTRIADDIFARMPEVIPMVAQEVPFGRIGEAEDIANVIAFLVDDSSGWVTGQIIEASGGQGL